MGSHQVHVFVARPAGDEMKTLLHLKTKIASSEDSTFPFLMGTRADYSRVESGDIVYAIAWI